MCAAVTVGLGRSGGDGEAEERAHRGSEGDQEAAGKITSRRHVRFYYDTTKRVFNNKLFINLKQPPANVVN